ncbi:MAG: hypothetical protein ACRCXH_07890 [Shewanella sp.]
MKFLLILAVVALPVAADAQVRVKGRVNKDGTYAAPLKSKPPTQAKQIISSIGINV